MSKTVQLHGGPWHGQEIAIPTGQDHFHIMGPSKPLEGDEIVPVREGIYSQVAGPRHTHDFEWDGWVSHDHQ